MDFARYVPYGLDRFGAAVELVKDEETDEIGVNITTSPIKDRKVVGQLSNLFPDAFEDGCKTARITLGSDGTLLASGIKNQFRSQIKSIMLDGRNRLFTDLEELESEKHLKKVANQTARAILMNGAEIDSEDCEVVCSHCWELKEALLDLVSLIKDSEAQLPKLLPGAPCHLPSDFRSSFDAQVPARFAALVKEALQRMLPEAEQLAKDLPAHIDKARRLIEE